MCVCMCREHWVSAIALLSRTRSHRLARLAVQWAPGVLLSTLLSPSYKITELLVVHFLFLVGSRDQDFVPMLLWQALYRLSICPKALSHFTCSVSSSVLGLESRGMTRPGPLHAESLQFSRRDWHYFCRKWSSKVESGKQNQVYRSRRE